MLSKRLKKKKRLVTSLILTFFVGSVLLGTKLPGWCMETGDPAIGMNGHLYLVACHAPQHETSLVILLLALSTIPAHGDNHCNSCVDIPLSTATAFQNPVNFAKELGKSLVVATGCAQPFSWLISTKPRRPVKDGFHTPHPNQLLASIRSVVLLI